MPKYSNANLKLTTVAPVSFIDKIQRAPGSVVISSSARKVGPSFVGEWNPATFS